MTDSPLLADDRADIAATLAGDDDAYRRLIERHQTEIARQLRRFSRDPLVIEQLTHDTFVEAYFSLRRFRGDSPWLHWLRRIAVRVGYRYWSSRREPRVELTADEWKQLAGNDGSIAASAAAELVQRVLSLLAPADRLVLTLIYLEGYSMAEAADRAGWTVIGTKVRASRARKRLREIVKRVRYD